jgi:hypothetical protein
MTMPKYTDPVRSINSELLHRLEMVSDHVSPLPGGSGRRLDNSPDPRFPNLGSPTYDVVAYYEHIASVRDTKTGVFYVAFKETGDALFARSQDKEKFPEWLMKTKEKQNERMIFIHQVYRHPKEIPIMRSHEDWLVPIADPSTFDTVAYFLSKNKVLTTEQYKKF